MKVIDEAEKLANYTVNVVSNEKHFPKRYRWIFSSKIGDSALKVNAYCHEANSFQPKDKEEMKIRLKFIVMAIAEASALLSYISLAKQQRDIDLSNVEYWLTTATYVKTILLKWREASRKQMLEMPE